MATGFSPESSLTFMWTDHKGKTVSNSIQYPATTPQNSQTSMMVSQIQVKTADSVFYKCEVKHPSLQGKLSEVVRNPVQPDKPCLEVTLNPPKVKEMFANNQAVLECVMTGGEKTVVEGAKVTWTMNTNERTQQITDSKTEPEKNLFRKTSTLTLSNMEWSRGDTVECSVQQKGSKTPIKKAFQFGSEAMKKPEMTILIEQGENMEKQSHVTLACVLTEFYPSDIYVMWKVEEEYQEGVTSKPLLSHDKFSVTSVYKVRKAVWDQNKRVTCAVKQVSSSNNSAPYIKTVSKAMEVAFGNGLYCSTGSEEEDDFKSLWSTTFSFIILFLCTIVYGSLISLFKLK
ncbi:hypothetical protein AGOR_G00226860 [Albula goreensis]|uniref:Ig-like domain-containing protein n=1 Tax=Albula goreensis TaxID=1534307 RepID=A0A8T3CMT6_9TELE|nr:hypothetical protein AGOR_G00226860 [Albula goreensis]